MLQPIPAACVHIVWDKVKPLIQRAIDKGNGDCFCVEDILSFLENRDMQLWIHPSENLSCCVTQIVTYPQKKVCQIIFVAGSKMGQWLSCDEQIAAWAKTNGCTRLEAACRDGWLRVLSKKNWRKSSVIIRKDLT